MPLVYEPDEDGLIITVTTEDRQGELLDLSDALTDAQPTAQSAWHRSENLTPADYAAAAGGAEFSFDDPSDFEEFLDVLEDLDCAVEAEPNS